MVTKFTEGFNVRVFDACTKYFPKLLKESNIESNKSDIKSNTSNISNVSSVDNNSQFEAIQDLPENLFMTNKTKKINTDSFTQRVSNMISSQTSIKKLNETILDEMKKESKKTTDLSLENLYAKAEDVIKLRDDLNDNFIKLQNHRVVLYENLVSAIFYKFYNSLITNAVTKSLDSQVIESKFNLDINSDLLTNLDGISMIVSGKQGNVDKTLSQDEKNLIMKYGKYFLELYDSIKDPVNLGETYVTSDGMMGKYKTFSFDNDDSNISGEICFKHEKETIDVDNIDEQNSNSVPTTVNTTIIANTDIRIQTGTEKNPYIIESNSDFINKYLTCSNQKIYFVLNSDINILSKDKMIMSANLDGNGHSITFSGSSIITGTYTQIKNVTFRLSFSTGNFEFYFGTSLVDTNIIFTSPVYNASIGDVTFIKKLAESSEGIGVNYELTNVKIYTKIDRYLKTKYDEGTKEFGVKRAESSGSYLGYYTLEFQNEQGNNNISDNTELESSNEEPTINIGSLSNTIISSGDVIFSGDLDLDDSSKVPRYFKDTAENVALTFDATYSDRCSIKILKYEGTDILPSITVKEFSGNDYVVASKSKTSSSQVKTANVIANLASYTYLDEKKINDEQIISDIIENVALLRESLEHTKDDAKSKREKSLNSVSDYLQSITYIESIRSANDSSYDTTYTTNIKAMIETLSGYVSVITSGYEIDGLEDPYKNVLKHIMMIESESNSLIMGIVESLKIINKEIDNYQLFHDTTIGNYEDKFSKMCETVSDVLTDDNYNDNVNSSNFNLTIPTVRQYKVWLDTFTKYSNDGIITAAQIYLAQELCINILKLKINDGILINKMLKSLVTDTLLRSCKKNLLCTTDGRIINIQALSYENELVNDYEIQVFEDAPYEDIAFQLTSLSEDLGILNSLDVTDILLNPKDNISEVTSLTSMIDLNIIKYILSDSVPSNILSRVSNIERCLNVCNKNFKTLLFEYHFRKIIDLILRVANKNSKSTIIDGIKKSLSEYTDYSKVEELIKKYISVWNFKYYSDFSNTSTIFRFIDDLDFVAFMYNYSETKYLKEFEIRLNAKGIADKIFDKIKDLWNGLIDWIF